MGNPSSIAKNKLSASADGKGILVSAASSPGTIIHTCYNTGTTSNSFDEVWIYAYNGDTATRTLTIQWGGTTTTDNMTLSIAPATGLVLVTPGLILQNTDVIRAFADVGSKVTIFGFVNVLSP